MAIAVAVLTAGCADSPKAADGRLRVVASFYPLAEIAQRVGGGRVEVTNLTPAGVEPHDVELTSDDVDAIEDATLVLYAGPSFQPAIAKAAARRASGSVDLARGIAHEGDPHFWLDPTLMVKAVERALRAFEAADPDHAASFRANAEQFGRELRGLDERFASALAHCERHELVTAHAAFSYLAARYGLTQQAVSGVSPAGSA